MVPDIGDISLDNSPTAIPIVTEGAVLEGTPHALLPATTAAYNILQLMDTSITPCTMRSTGIVTPHPTLTTSPADITHTPPWTRASPAPAPPTTQHRNLSQEKPNSAQDQPPHKPHHSKTVTIQDSPSDSSSYSESDPDPLNY